MATLTGCGDNKDPQYKSLVNRADFQTSIDGKQTDLYYLTNSHGIEVTVTNFGGRIVEFWVLDHPLCRQAG